MRKKIRDLRTVLHCLLKRHRIATYEFHKTPFEREEGKFCFDCFLASIPVESKLAVSEWLAQGKVPKIYTNER